MPFFFIYLLKLSVSLAAVFLFYHFVLRKLTFYNWNRWYLLGYSLLSFFVPLVDISPVLQRNEWSATPIVQWIPLLHDSATAAPGNSTAYSLTPWNILSLLVITGAFIMLFRLLFQFISFRRMMKKAHPIAIGFIPGDGMKLYQVNENIIPFSFGNSIFINRHLHTEEEIREIIRHEFVHVKQRHSLDIISGELLCLLNWYNPFAWLLRRSIRQNLEFIADDRVLENGIDRKQYQYLLLKVIGNKHFSIAPKFNFSSLKKRIAMMNKMKSARVHIVKFLFILPLGAVLLLAFRNSYAGVQLKSPKPPGRPGTTKNGKADILLLDTIPDKMEPNNKGYYIDIIGDTKMSIVTTKDKKNNVYSNYIFDNKNKCTIIVKDKDMKEVTRMSLTEWTKKEKYYVDMYGELPPPPPPPPPVPAEGVTPVTPVVPVAPVRPARVTTDITPVAETTGDEINLSGISNEYEITNKKAVIKLKDGRVEKYDLTDKEQRSAFEKKYGKIINVNTHINSDANVNIATHINASVDVTPAVVTVDGKPITATVAPATVTGIHSATAVVAPVTVTGKLSAASVTPSPVRSAVSGTTVITPRAAVAGVTVIDDYGYMITGKEDILVTITKNTTRQQLDDFIKQMKAKDIELTYDNIEYNSKGQLTELSGTMKSKDGHSNFVASDFETLILAMIRKGEKTWFKVSVKDKEVI